MSCRDARGVDNDDTTASGKTEQRSAPPGTCAAHAHDCFFVILVAFERARAMVRRDARRHVPAAEVESVVVAVLAEAWIRREQILAAPHTADAIRALTPAAERSLRRRPRREQCVDPRLLAEGLHVAPEADRPEDQTVAAEDWSALAAILARAAPNQRDLLIARFVEGKSLPEVAGELGVTAKAARRRLERAIERVRRLVVWRRGRRRG